MSGSVNKVTLIGNLGDAPDVRTMQSGDKVCNLSIATSESWKNKETGERQSKTEWHRVVVFNQGLMNVCENYLQKGSKIYIEGQLETRSWEQDGQKKYTTEIVLRPYRGEIKMLDSRENNQQTPANQDGVSEAGLHDMASNQTPSQLEDEIPF
jgi:single-strand DNA-binding protein